MRKLYNDKEFDNYLRHIFENYEAEVPQEVYSRLKKNRKIKFISNKWYYLSIPIVIIVSSFLFFNQKQYNYQALSIQPTTLKNFALDKPFYNVISNNNKTPINTAILSKPLLPNSNNDKIFIDNKPVDFFYSESTNYNDNKLSYSYKIKVVASTCKKENGEVIIDTENENITAYCPQINKIERHFKHLRSGYYTFYVKNGEIYEDTLNVFVPDSGNVQANFKIYDISTSNQIQAFFENHSLVNNLSWKNDKSCIFKWYLGDGNVSNMPEPTHFYNSEGQYSVILVVQSKYGCKDSIEKKYVITRPLNVVEIPNVFSPNNDGINDIFQPTLQNISYFECTIFDRNGNLIYEWKDPNGFWDGKIHNTNKIAPPGVYYYIIKAISQEGKTITQKGMIQLVL